MNNKIFSLVLFLAFTITISTVVMTPKISQAEKLNITETQTYVVVKGDTLWHITGKFFNDPFRWPDLWKINPQVANPHLIYPGDTLQIDPDGFMVVKRAEPKDVIIEDVIFAVDDDDDLIVDVTPQRPDDIDLDRIDIAPGDDPNDLPTTKLTEPSVPDLKVVKLTTATGDELEKPYVVLPKLISSGIVSKKEIKKNYKPLGAIIESKEHDLVFAGNEMVLMSFYKLKDVSVGDKFTAYVMDDKVRHPITNKKIGQIVNAVAAIEITAIHEEVAEGVLFEAYEEVFDIEHAKLIPYKDLSTKVTITNASQVIDDAYVISGFDETAHFAKSYFAYIDKGKKDGLRAGNILQMYRSRSVSQDPLHKKEYLKMPDHDIARAIVVETSDRTSLVMIIRTFKEVRIDDKVRTTGVIEPAPIEPESIYEDTIFDQ